MGKGVTTELILKRSIPVQIHCAPIIIIVTRADLAFEPLQQATYRTRQVFVADFLATRETLFRGLRTSVPSGSFDIISLRCDSLSLDSAELMPSQTVTLLGSFAVPTNRFAVVPLRRP
jgi:hypothetical protein